MDQVQEIQDQIIKDEIVRNRREIEHPTYGALLLRRATPRDEAAIAQLRGREYHKLLKDDNVLSTSQLKQIAINRGIWNTKMDEEKDALLKQMGSIIAIIESLGYISPDKIFERYSDAITALVDEMKDNEEAKQAVARLVNLEDKGQMDARDKKLVIMAATSTKVDELLDEVETLKSQVILLESLNDTQDQLLERQKEYAIVFMDSLENRVSRIETMAKIFYCVRRPDGSQLWDSFEKLMDETAENVSVLVDEIYYFEAGITRGETGVDGAIWFYSAGARLTKTIRRIARAPDIQLRWRVSNGDARAFYGVLNSFELDTIQLELVKWVMLYNNVESNLYGKDRTDAINAMYDDDEFDQWMKSFHRERAKQEAEAEIRKNPSAGRNQRGMTKVSKDEYLKKSGKEFGADNLPWEKK